MFWLLAHKSEDEAEIRKAKETADFSIKALLLSGGIVAVIYFVNWMSRMDNAAYFGPNLAHIVLGMFYSLIGAALLLVVKERL